MPTNTSLATSLIRGPAQVQWKGSTFWSQGDIRVTIKADLSELIESSDGYLDQTEDEVVAEVTFTPAGQISTALLTALFPYFSAVLLPGASLVGTNGSVLNIYSKAGTAYTFPSAVVTQMPSIQFGVAAVDGQQTMPLFGPVTFTVLRQAHTPWSVAGSLWSEESFAYPGDSLFASSQEISGPARGTFVTTHTSQSIGPFSSPSGFQIESKLDLVPMISDAYGTLDFTLEAIHLSCKCQPVQLATNAQSLGPSPSVIDTLFNIQGPGAIRGGSRTLASGTLNVWMNGLAIQMQSMAIREQSFLFGRSLRQGEIIFDQTSDTTPPAQITLYPLT